MNNHYPYSILLALLGLAALASCTTSESPGSKPFGSGGTGPYGESGEAIYDGDPLPPRDDSKDPNKADYDTLAPYTVYFSTDSFAIDSTERGKLESIATWMESNSSSTVVIAGHCDERGTTQYNLNLGERRALAVRAYLIGLGVASDRMTTYTYGEEKPAVQGTGESVWSKNRRAQTGIFR